jgi:hypothetical protein
MADDTTDKSTGSFRFSRNFYYLSQARLHYRDDAFLVSPVDKPTHPTIKRPPVLARFRRSRRALKTPFSTRFIRFGTNIRASIEHQRHINNDP